MVEIDLEEPEPPPTLPNEGMELEPLVPTSIFYKKQEQQQSVQSDNDDGNDNTDSTVDVYTTTVLSASLSSLPTMGICCILVQFNNQTKIRQWHHPNQLLLPYE